MTTQQCIDDILLLKRIAKLDQSALSELYDRYARVVYALAFKILESVEEAEEVVLDVFSQVWRTAGSYDDKRGRVDAWLFMLARSRSLDRLRALQRLARAATASVDAAIAQSPPQWNPEEHLLISERRAQVLAALAQLPEEQRLVLELAYYKGLTHAEIAAQTGKSLGTVKTRIRLGLSKLREALGSLEPEK
jgi:RNA polymerase sigma factor (sigma-70 family)